MKFNNPLSPPTVSLVGFDESDAGAQLLLNVLSNYLVSWWGFRIQTDGPEYGDIVIVNNDPIPVAIATERRDTSRPFIVLSSSRGGPHIMAVASDHERIGGFCRIVHKPGGPSRIGSMLKMCLHVRNIGSRSATRGPDKSEETRITSHGLRRHSEEHGKHPNSRPPMIPRSTTANAIAPLWMSNDIPRSITPTVSVGSGGTLLKSSIGTIHTTPHQFRVLVMEDNSILRSLLYVFSLGI